MMSQSQSIPPCIPKALNTRVPLARVRRQAPSLGNIIKMSPVRHMGHDISNLPIQPLVIAALRDLPTSTIA